MFTATIVTTLLLKKAIQRCNYNLIGSKPLAFMSSQVKPGIIEYEELKQLLENDNCQLIDVRQPKELKEDGKIPGSINIPLAEVEAAFKLSEDQFEKKFGVPYPEPHDANLIFSCRSGKRATQAFNDVQKVGKNFSNARVYLGSFQDWINKGGKVDKN